MEIIDILSKSENKSFHQYTEFPLNNSLNIKWNWIKAHSGNPLNEEVDLLAKKAAQLD
mgnify:CR=1 FL=1